MNNQIFDAIKTQLSHSGSGSIQRFNEIFERTFSHFDKESIGEDKFSKFVYFDFLHTVGTIETFTQNEKIHWGYLGENFSYRYGSNVFTLGMDSSETLRFGIFEKNILPLAGRNDNEDCDSLHFLDNLEKLQASWKDLLLQVSDVGHMSEDVLSLEVFDFDKKLWLEKKESSLSDGLYRSNRLQFRKNFYIFSKGRKYKYSDSELIFILAVKLLLLPIGSILIYGESSITVPWKIRLPSLLKRTLVSGATEMKYKYDGITFQYDSRETALRVINLLEKASA